MDRDSYSLIKYLLSAVLLATMLSGCLSNIETYCTEFASRKHLTQNLGNSAPGIVLLWFEAMAKEKELDATLQGCIRREEKHEAEGEEDLEAAAERILEALGQAHRFFAELLDLFPNQSYGTIARAIGSLIEKDKIHQDKDGRYQLKVPHSA